jgi:3-phosphoglycerate kinase
MIVLHEVRLNANRFQAARVVALQKKAAIILENARFKDQNTGQEAFSNFQLMAHWH